jgi:SAM-dependent methyltransferase
MPYHDTGRPTDNPCTLCANKHGNYLLTAEENMYGMGKVFDYLHCGQCGVLHILQVPHDLASYYPPGDYYSTRRKKWAKQAVVQLRDRSYVHDSLVGRFLRSQFPNPALQATLNITQDRAARILDVGCGGGTLLRALAALGFKHLYGVDPLITATQTHKGLQLLPGELKDVHGEFDVIMFHHSLEHMPDQVGVLAEARKRLAEDGKVLICIPTVDSIAFETYGHHWGQLDAPRHLYLHSRRSIEQVANAAGFDVATLYCNSQPMQFWASEMHRDGHTLNAPEQTRYKRMRRRFFRELAQWANDAGRGDQIALHLQASRA